MDTITPRELTWERGDPERFIGVVHLAPLAQMPDERGLTALAVAFSPGARTGWHSHPHGQTLYVLSGSGVVAEANGERVVVGAGDVVVTEPGVVHWHGARPDAPMVHLSLTTGGPTEWTGAMVDDEDYLG